MRELNRAKGLCADLARYAIYFLEAGSLATKPADVEQLGATNLVAANLFDLVDNLRVEREDTFHALAEAHLANGKGALRAAIDGDYQAFKGLQAFLVAFLDLYLDANLVSRRNLGKVGALELFCQTLHYGMNGHSRFLLLDSEL